MDMAQAVRKDRLFRPGGRTMKSMFRRACVAAAGIGVLIAAGSGAVGQSSWTGNIRFLVGAQPGGAIDPTRG